MVDMSSGAVTERLRVMDELWLLSVKLMNSKKVKSGAVDIESPTASIDEFEYERNGDDVPSPKGS